MVRRGREPQSLKLKALLLPREAGAFFFMDNDSVHSAAQSGYTTASQAYVKGRPDYPPEVRQWLEEDLGLCEGKRVLDLGAGTGKFLPRLLETGAAISAVEPVAAMRHELERRFPGVMAYEGKATAIPLADASLDAVVCAQAFHWFASAEALDEIARVLRPGGKLGLIWNVRDARIPWVAELDSLVNAREGETPRFHSGEWRKAFPHPRFGELQERYFSHHHVGTVDDVIRNRILSTSFIAALDAIEKEHVMAELEAFIARTPELSGGGEVSMPYRTQAFFTKMR